MNALQSLTGGPTPGTAGIGMPPRGPGQSLSGMGGLGAMGQPMPLSGQPPPGTSGMAPHGMAVVSTATPQTQLQLQQVALQQQQQQQQQQFQQQQAALQQQQQQQQFQAQQNAMQQQFQAVVQQQHLQQQQQHLIKLHHQSQQQQIQQQQLQRMAQLQLQQQQQQQQQQALQAQPPMQQPPMQQPQPPPSQALPQQLQQMHHPQHHQPPPQAQQSPVAQSQPAAQLPPQSQSQPLVSQAQGLPGPMLYAAQQQQLKFVRAPMVVQQQQVQPQVQQVQPQVQQVQPQVQQQQAAQAAQMVAPGVQMIAEALAQGGMHIRARFPPTSTMSAGPSSSISLGGQPTAQVGQSSLTMLSSPSPGQQVQTPQSMPPPPQPSPQPGSQPNSNVSSGPAPSPSSFLPSPSPQPSQSPVTARTPQNFSVPSPGPLNTPVNPSSVMSPAGSSQAEEQQYLDKLKQLSKYIEPLRRMINKIDKNEDRKKDLSKMKSLLDILTDPSKRCPLKTLQKCEIALEKLKNDMAVPTPPPPPVLPTKQQDLCQPLLDAVLANIRSPVFNHSLYRTFVPAMMAIHGPPIVSPVVCSRKRRFEEEEHQSIPNVLQGEVARLDPKFLVNLDPSHCSNNGTVHLICKLDDKDLPSVPPLELSVPADYPAQSPMWIDRQWQYDANPFLQSVHQCMTSRLLQLPDKHSVTALLNTWAQSIHQACLSAA
ncbi:mediator of RNA polymerase II transcription subunit 15 isoform X5 [Onychomys torridus]|nr:mediator of RNA polymerase II transcription subunit 15 isoform X5 [Onychomys torridus]